MLLLPSLVVGVCHPHRSVREGVLQCVRAVHAIVLQSAQADGPKSAKKPSKRGGATDSEGAPATPAVTTDAIARFYLLGHAYPGDVDALRIDAGTGRSLIDKLLSASKEVLADFSVARGVRRRLQPGTSASDAAVVATLARHAVAFGVQRPAACEALLECIRVRWGRARRGGPVCMCASVFACAPVCACVSVFFLCDVMATCQAADCCSCCSCCLCCSCCSCVCCRCRCVMAGPLAKRVVVVVQAAARGAAVAVGVDCGQPTAVHNCHLRHHGRVATDAGQ